jgi:DNA-binding NarL/FixJ family response regulator
MGETYTRSSVQPQRTVDGNVSPLRVLLVDDYKPFLQFISSTLRKRSGIRIVGQTSDGLEAVRLAEELRPDLIVLDIGLPSLNGIEAARLIREVSPNSAMLFLSIESSAEVIQEALSAGACDYVRKARAGSELLPAIDTIISARRLAPFASPPSAAPTIP